MSFETHKTQTLFLPGNGNVARIFLEKFPFSYRRRSKCGSFGKRVTPPPPAGPPDAFQSERCHFNLGGKIERLVPTTLALVREVVSSAQLALPVSLFIEPKVLLEIFAAELRYVAFGNHFQFAYLSPVWRNSGNGNKSARRGRLSWLRK